MNDTGFWLVGAVAATITSWVAYFMGVVMMSNIFSVIAITIGLYVLYKLMKEEWL